MNCKFSQISTSQNTVEESKCRDSMALIPTLVSFPTLTHWLPDCTLTYVPKLSWHNYVTWTIQIIQMPPESVIFSAGEAVETCHLLNLKWLNFEEGSFLSLSLSLARSRSTRSRLSLSPVAWPNPEAERHYCISVTFDGPGLKQIYIPLVDFKRCLNNDASQRRVNEACSGLAASDFKINLIRARDIICAPPSSFCSFALTLCVGLSLPSHNSTFLPFFSPPFNIPSLFIFSLFPHSTPLSVLSSSLPFTPAPQ